MRLVMFDQLFGYQPLTGAPDEIHLGVRRTQRQPRFEDQKHAAVKEEDRTDQPQHDRNPTKARSRKGHDANGNTRSDEYTNSKIESCQCSLQ